MQTNSYIPCKLSHNKKRSHCARNSRVSMWISAGVCRASYQTFDNLVAFQLFSITQLRLRPSEHWPVPTRPNIVFVKFRLTYPDSRFCEARPHSKLFSDSHVRISISREHFLKLLELIRSEVSPLPSLFSFLLQPIAIHGRGLCRTKRKQPSWND